MKKQDDIWERIKFTIAQRDKGILTCEQALEILIAITTENETGRKKRTL